MVLFNFFKRKKVYCSNSHDLGCVDCSRWIYNCHEPESSKRDIHIANRYKECPNGCKNFKNIVTERVKEIPKITDIHNVHVNPVEA